MVHGPGLLISFGNQLWVLLDGVGAVDAWSAARGPRFYDGLVEAVGDSVDFQPSRACVLTVLWETPSRRATKLTLPPYPSRYA